MGIAKERITILNDNPVQQGKWVLYWMQQSQRAHDNPALEYAIHRANRLDLPVLVVFALTDSYPEANLRHYRFMLEGLAETQALLARRRIGMVVQKGDPVTVLAQWMGQSALLVCDVGYTRHQRAWRQAVSQSASCRTVAVEGDVVVPVAVVSPKAEYAARTIRPKISRHLEQFLVPCPRYRPKRASVDIKMEGLDLGSIDAVLNDLDIDRSVSAVSPFFKGGPAEAKKRLRRFIAHRLQYYEKNRNQPQTDDISHMSPYLHFGQIHRYFWPWRSPMHPRGPGGPRGLPGGGHRPPGTGHQFRSLHAGLRPVQLPARLGKKKPGRACRRPAAALYDRKALQAADTHDPYWNAAMVEMRDTGFMHNYMRMYWGKKILEWSSSPEAAFDTAIRLNNRYFLDGRDPNSFAGVGWIFGLHDRAWFEREIFGKVRFLAASGLERKCDIHAYVAKVAALSRKAGRAGAGQGRGVP
jgi:deoxyribodipyrimidine photo-lyase